QPTQTSTGRNTRANVPGDTRSLSPFVHVPTWAARAISSPAPATIAIEIQKRPIVCIPTWVAPQSPSPASAAATASVRPRDASYKPYIRISLHLVPLPVASGTAESHLGVRAPPIT